MGDPNRGLRRLLASRMPPDMAAALTPEPAGARVDGGKAARAHGAALEKWLADQHRTAALAGLAHVRHVGAPVIVGAGGRPTEWAGTGPADFQGQLPGGRSVAIEAKSREGRLTREEIAEHQRADLDACAAGGGLAVIVARLGGAVHAIPWREVPWCSPRGGSPSIGAADVAAWRIDARCERHPLDARWGFYLSALTGEAAMRGGSV